MAEGNGQNGSARWAGVIVTVVLAAGAMTIQWGVVTTKLQQVEKRLDEFIGEARSIRDECEATPADGSRGRSMLSGQLRRREQSAVSLHFQQASNFVLQAARTRFGKAAGKNMHLASRLGVQYKRNFGLLHHHLLASVRARVTRCGH